MRVIRYDGALMFGGAVAKISIVHIHSTQQVVMIGSFWTGGVMRSIQLSSHLLIHLFAYLTICGRALGFAMLVYYIEDMVEDMKLLTFR